MNMTIHYIYKITNKLNGKLYIGRSKNPAMRLVRHIKIAEKFSETDNHFQALHSAIKKYGKENFCLEIIDVCDDVSVNDKEIFWIAEFKANIKNFGYNLTLGGDGIRSMSEESKIKRRMKMLGRKYSEEHKNKISKSNMGKIISEIHRRKISEANSGEKNGMYSRTHLDEARAKISDFQKNRIRRKLTDEEKNLLSQKNKKIGRPPRIALDVKEKVKSLYDTGSYTKRKIAKELNLKYNTVVNILR